MQRLLVPAALIALVAALVSSASAGTPVPLKAQLRAQKAKVVKLKKRTTADAATIAALTKKLADDDARIDKLSDDAKDDNGKIATLNATVAALTTQLGSQSQAGLAAVLAGTPDDLWKAVVAIYGKFPTLPADEICGYDKLKDGNTTGPAPNDTNYTFTLWTNCPDG